MKTNQMKFTNKTKQKGFDRITKHIFFIDYIICLDVAFQLDFTKICDIVKELAWNVHLIHIGLDRYEIFIQRFPFLLSNSFNTINFGLQISEFFNNRGHFCVCSIFSKKTTLTHSIWQIQLWCPRSKWNMGEILAFLA